MGTKQTIRMRIELFNLLESELGDAWINDDSDRTDDTKQKVIEDAEHSLLCIREAERRLREWLIKNGK